VTFFGYCVVLPSVWLGLEKKGVLRMGHGWMERLAIEHYQEGWFHQRLQGRAIARWASQSVYWRMNQFQVWACRF